MFLCTLAYRVIWEIKQRLSDVFAAKDSELNCETIREMWELFSEISIGKIKIGGNTFNQLSEISTEQKKLLKNLGVAINKKTLEKILL